MLKKDIITKVSSRRELGFNSLLWFPIKEIILVLSK